MNSDRPVLVPGPSQPPALRADWEQRGYLTRERIGWLWERASDQWPDRIAVIDDAGAYTYRELARRATAVATQLLDAGVQAGDIVSWVMPNRLEGLVIPAALWRIGAISNPLVPLYRERELSFVLGQTRPAAVISAGTYRGRDRDAELDRILADLGCRPALRLSAAEQVRDGWHCLVSPGADAPGRLPPEVSPSSADEPVLIIYTSGTTASPKGVIHTGAALMAEGRLAARERGMSANDRTFMASPLAHPTGFELATLVPPLTGSGVVLTDRWDATRAVDMIEEHRATVSAGATPMLRELLAEYRARDLASSALRMYLCGGTAVPSQLIEDAESLGVVAFRGYGMSEMPSISGSNPERPFHERTFGDGRLTEGVVARVVADDGTVRADGEVGELHLMAPQRMWGFVDPTLNAESLLADGWLQTGDLAVLDGRNITIVGRVKEIVNRGGEKFSTREVEDLLVTHPDIEDVSVVGVPGGRLGERVGAAVVATRPDLAVEDIIAHLEHERLARQKLPEVVRFVAELPRTAAGKVRRPAVVKLLSDDSTRLITLTR